MSGVKNLRAMFEQKGESSPPDRGRSPGPLQHRQPNTSESPRPLSKVRTNFVAIEKDGRIGLQRETSTDSVLSTGRKLSTGTEGETPPAFPLKSGNLFGERLDRGKTPTMDPIPQSPAKEAGASQEAAPETKAAEASKTAQVETKTDKGTPIGKVATKDKAEGQSISTQDKKADAGAGRAQNGQNGTAAKKADKKAPAASASKTASKPVPTSVGTKSTTKPPAKSPTVAKTPTSPAHPRTPKFPPKPTEKKASHPEKQSTPKPASTATRATASSSSSRPPAIEISPSSTGFVKPKPKSPTRPVKLPAGLITHTAASASRTGAPRQSLSRQSGSYTTSHSNRSPSRASIASTTLSATGTKNLKRQSSTINRPRPSFGPPPKPQAKDHPVTRREKEVDEGFLARMMRPTQASASKTADKSLHPPTPPRKAPAPLAKRPSTRDGHHVAKKETAPKKDVASTAKAPVVKSASAGSSKEAHKSAAKAIAPVAEKAATAEDAIKVAQEAEGQLAPATGHTTAEDLAPVVEQAATAETAIRVAKEAEGEIALPEESPADPVAPEAEKAITLEAVADTLDAKPVPLEAVPEAKASADTSSDIVSDPTSNKNSLGNLDVVEEPEAAGKQVEQQEEEEEEGEEKVEKEEEEAEKEVEKVEKEEDADEPAPSQSEEKAVPAPVEKLIEEMEQLDINGENAKATALVAEGEEATKETPAEGEEHIEKATAEA